MSVDIDAQIQSMLGGGNASEGTFWNFSNPDNEGFSPMLMGTVVKISFAQERQWNPETRKFEGGRFWDDGNPRLMYRLHIRDANDNEWLHEIKPKSKAMMEDWLPVCPGNNLMGLLGMEIQVEAAQPVVNPQTGQPIPFSSAMRRTFKVTVIGPGRYESEGVDQESFKSVMSRRINKQQMPAQRPQMPYTGQQQQPGTQMPVTQQAPAMAYPGPMSHMPQAPVQMPQPQVVPQQAAYIPDVYDQDIPF